MPLVLKLAARNLLYDKLRFAATVIGIVFSIVLVTVQLGLFVSFERTVAIMIDHAPADPAARQALSPLVQLPAQAR